jgi:hypothetical protein
MADPAAELPVKQALVDLVQVVKATPAVMVADHIMVEAVAEPAAQAQVAVAHLQAAAECKTLYWAQTITGVAAVVAQDIVLTEAPEEPVVVAAEPLDQRVAAVV